MRACSACPGSLLRRSRPERQAPTSGGRGEHHEVVEVVALGRVEVAAAGDEPQLRGRFASVDLRAGEPRLGRTRSPKAPAAPLPATGAVLGTRAAAMSRAALLPVGVHTSTPDPPGQGRPAWWGSARPADRIGSPERSSVRPWMRAGRVRRHDARAQPRTTAARARAAASAWDSGRPA